MSYLFQNNQDSQGQYHFHSTKTDGELFETMQKYLFVLLISSLKSQSDDLISIIHRYSQWTVYQIIYKLLMLFITWIIFLFQIYLCLINFENKKANWIIKPKNGQRSI